MICEDYSIEYNLSSDSDDTEFSAAIQRQNLIWPWLIIHNKNLSIRPHSKPSFHFLLPLWWFSDVLILFVMAFWLSYEIQQFSNSISLCNFKYFENSDCIKYNILKVSEDYTFCSALGCKVMAYKHGKYDKLLFYHRPAQLMLSFTQHKKAANKLYRCTCQTHVFNLWRCM